VSNVTETAAAFAGTDACITKNIDEIKDRIASAATLRYLLITVFTEMRSFHAYCLMDEPHIWRAPETPIASRSAHTLPWIKSR
jgi:hypothetical protein